MFPHLFSAGRIGSMVVKNRLFMAPMVRNYADPQGRSTGRYLAHIERIARGGVGAMTLEASFVAPGGKGFTHQLGLHDDTVIPALRQLVDAAHRHGAKIGIQLFHAGRQTESAVCGSTPIAPSALPCPVKRETPQAMTVEQIGVTVRQFGAAAQRAMDAGFDYVELHAAHGYLIDQFLSANSNIRTDGYGGSLGHRMRFLREIYAAVREQVASAPIIVRLSAEEGTLHGLTLTETIPIARTLEELGVDAIHVSTGAYGSYQAGQMIAPMSMPDALLARLAEPIAAAVSIPVITVGKIRTPETAEDLLNCGVANFVALGRPLLADPDWPNKAKVDGLDGINKCIACQEGCISRLFEQKDVQCVVNPDVGREEDVAALTPMAPRRVMVVGGGPAGMTAALAARRAGHTVDLFEEAERLGGQLFDAEAEPHRPGWTELRRSLVRQVRQEPDLAVHLKTCVTADMICGDPPDTLIIATGSKPRAASWPTGDGIRVLNERTLLEEHLQPSGKVVIAGGGCAGAETAELLAETGCAVTIVDQRGAIATDAPIDERALLLERLRRLDVTLVTDATIVEAGAGRVTVDSPHGRFVIPADTLVLCHGSDADNALAKAVAGRVEQVLCVGDCVAPRRVLNATREGAWAGLALGSRSTPRDPSAGIFEPQTMTA